MSNNRNGRPFTIIIIAITTVFRTVTAAMG